MVETLGMAADVLVVIMAGWVSFTFWRAYKASGRKDLMVLSAIFLFVGVFKLTQLTLEDVLGMEEFAWMDSMLAMELLWLITAASIIFVLSSGQRFKGKLRGRQGAGKPPGADKAA
jgi:hypothetical protein